MPTSFYFTKRSSSSSSSSSKPTSSPHQASAHNGPMKSSTSNGATKEKVTVKYKECRKNHAASIGGYAVDGCREFMAAGEEGTKDALRCAACSCHRSFHKRVVEGEIAILDACDCSSDS